MDGDKAANVEAAIGRYERALEVHTREAAPQDWAETSFNLMLARKQAEQWRAALDLALAVARFGREWVRWSEHEASLSDTIALLQDRLCGIAVDV